MELAVSVDTNLFDQGTRRTSIWSRRVASMSRRLEARWATAVPSPANDPAAHDLLCAECLARAEHEAARFALCGQD